MEDSRVVGTKRAIRRVELLVVLVAGGLLLASLGAVGRTARERSKGVVCLANLGQLGKGWHKFAEDHDGLLVGGCNYTNYEWKDRWVERPKRTPYYAGDPPSWPYNDYVDSNTVTQTFREYGMRAGRLWPYVKNINVYHCPADTRMFNPDPYSIYQSYSITGTMRAEEIQGWNSAIEAYQKFHQIDRPETKLVFIEEAVRSQWYNIGSWIIRIITDSDTGQILYDECEWVDPMSNWHGNMGALSFADGHAILKRWEDKFTIDFNEAGNVYGYPPDDEKADITFMAKGYGGIRR